MEGREYPKIKQKRTWRNVRTIMMLYSVQAVEAGLCFFNKIRINSRGLVIN